MKSLIFVSDVPLFREAYEMKAPSDVTAHFYDVLVRNKLPIFIFSEFVDEKRAVISVVPPKGQMEPVGNFIKKNTPRFFIYPPAPEDVILVAEIVGSDVGDIVETILEIIAWEVEETDSDTDSLL